MFKTLSGQLPPWEDLVVWAEESVQGVLRDMPPEIAERAKQVPVSYEHEVSQEILDDGLDADLLGLFIGEAYPDQGETTGPMPGQIVLFLVNLWLFADADKEIFIEEVEKTYIHELGHYLGMEEDEIDERGLS